MRKTPAVKVISVVQYFILFAGCLSISMPVLAADKKATPAKVVEAVPAQPSVPALVPAVLPPAVPAVHSITQAAVQGGALACTSRINQVASFLTGNTVSGAYLFLNKAQPDQRIFSTSIEMQPAGSSAMYASASFAPSPAGGCGAVYDAVEYSPKSCTDIEKSVFKDLKRTGAIKKDIVVLDAGAMKVFLMPAGSGCVVIKKEIVQ